MLFQRLLNYVKAKEYYEKALSVNTEIGCRKGEAASYNNLGNLFKRRHEFAKAEEYLEKALSIVKESSQSFQAGT